MKQIAKIQEEESLRLQKILNDGEKALSSIMTGSTRGSQNDPLIGHDVERYKKQATLFM